MSNFALLATDPSGDIISSINYLLATQGQTTANANLANALVANATSGTITTSNDPDYLAYLYQYINVRYADSADGSVNFSTSPTNRLYYGVRNSSTTSASSNPTDYIWTQVAGGGFGTTNFLYYATNGGRQIQWYVGTAPPGSNFIITTDAQYIDLDVLSASLVNTTLQILYSDGQVFNRNTANVWSPTEVANIISTTANISAVRNNVVIAAIGQTISYNAAAQTWTTTTNPSPNLNANTFSFGTLISSSNNYYQPVSYVDTYANLVLAKSVTVVTSGANGANGANGVNASTISVEFDNTQLFVRDVNLVWTPNVNANGVIQTNATITVSQANNVIGQVTRTINYNTEYSGATIIGGSTTMSNIGVVEKDGYTYFCYYNPSDNGNLVLSGGNIQADVFLVGGGAVGITGTSGSPPGTNLYMGGQGGQGKFYPNITLTPGNHFIAMAKGGATQFSNAALYGASNGTGQDTGTGNLSNNSSNDPYTVTTGNANVWYGGQGTPDPWNAIDWILEPPYDNNPAHLVTTGIYDNWFGYQRIYDGNGLAWFGGGGGSNQSQMAANAGVLNTYYLTGNGPYPANSPDYGGLGGGGSGGGGIWPSAGNLGPLNYWTGPGIYGGGGTATTTLVGGIRRNDASSGIAIIRVATNDLLQWWLDGNTAGDIDGNNFTFSNAVTSSTSYFQNVTYSNIAANANIGTSLSVAVVTAGEQGNVGTQGNRGFIPLAYVVTSSDPTVLSNAALSTAFAAPRSNVTPPIGTGFSPITGDTAQFIYPTTNASVVKTYSANTAGWTLADGQVIDGNLIVTGTITSAQMNTNSLYALTIQSTSANVGSNTSPGFWLQANTGNARFGGGLNVGNSLVVGNTAVIGSNLTVGANANIGSNLIVGTNATIGNNLTVGNSATIGSDLIVGNNANIGANLFVSGLITTGNLNNNTVNTTTITSNAVSFFTGFQDNADLLTFYPNTSLYSLTNTISVTTTVTNTKVLVSGQVLSVIVANTASVLDDFTSNIGIRMLDGSTGLVYILTNEEKLFTPGVVGNVIQGDHAYYETGIVLTLANVATYSFGVYGKVTGTANIFFTDTLNRRNAVSNLKR